MPAISLSVYAGHMCVMSRFFSFDMPIDLRDLVSEVVLYNIIYFEFGLGVG